MQKNSRKKKIPWQKGLFSLVFIFIGGICGLCIAHHVDKLTASGQGAGSALLTFGLLLLGFLAVLFLQIIVHEGGHLVFGLLSGYTFSSFRVGSFMVIKPDGKLRFKRLSLAGTGGQCLMAPPDLVDGKMPFVLYNLGGSLLNLISAALCVILYFPARAVPYLPLFLLMGAIVVAVYALMNGIPLRLGAVDNDGYNAWSMGKDPAALRAFWLQLKLNALLTQGVRLKDMPEEWFQIPEGENLNNSMTAALGVFACNRMMDAHRFQSARAAMEKLLAAHSALIGIYRNLLLNDLLYCELLFENRPDRIKRMLTNGQKKFMKAMKTYPAILRTAYAYTLLAQQDEKQAAQIKQKFEAIGRAYPYPSDWESERELMDLAEAKARTQQEV